MGRRPSNKKIDLQFSAFVMGFWRKNLPELSGRQFAKNLNMSDTYFFKIVKGRVPAPSKEIVIQFAEVLNCDKDILLGIAGYAAPGTFTIVEMNRPFGLLPMQLIKYDASTFDQILHEMQEEGVFVSDQETQHIKYTFSNLKRHEMLKREFLSRLSNKSLNPELSTK